MALVRIMVDGCSLLQQWSGIAPGKPRHSQSAREALIDRLTRYLDSCGTPITVIFAEPPSSPEETFASAPDLEVVYAASVQRAAQCLQKNLHRLTSSGDVLVVTDEPAQRAAVQAAGGVSASSADFIKRVEHALRDLENELEHHNQEENLKFISPNT